MPRRKLSLEEIATLKTLKQKGQSNVQIAEKLGVTEGAGELFQRKFALLGDEYFQTLHFSH